MEDPELAVLADLINSDNDFDDNELDNLSNGEEPVNSTPVRSRNMSNSNGKEISNNATTNDGDPSKKITEMENYIKFLESQLRTQNNEKSKSSETANTSANNKRSSPDEQKYKIENKMGKNDKMSVENHKKENIKKHNTLESTKASSATQISLDSGLVKKPRIAHAPKSTQSSSIQQNESRVSGTKRKAEAPVSQSSTAKRPAQDLNGVTDSFSGLRIVNPLISSATMERRMEGRKMIKISSIQSRIRNNDIEGDWVTIGVVIQKLPPKTSSKGNQYSIWKLSDLAFHMENAIVSLFLFGESHKEHWKTSEGTVIAVLNPSILPARDKQSKDIALSVDNPKKMMLMGVSQDFGRCQSARKADGAKCSNFVNKAQGDFCEYHVRREYSKMRSKRMECQQGYGAPSKPHGKNLKQKVSAESFFYEGRTVSSYTPPLQKEKVTLKSLAANVGKEHLNSWKGKQEENKDPDYKDGPSQEFLNLLKIPSVGSRNLMRQLHQEEEKEEKETQKTISASEFLKANKIQRRSGPVSRPSSTVTRTFGEATSSKNTSGPLFKTPVLGRGLNCDDGLIFDENIPLNFTGENVAFDKGKKRALALVREVGPFNPKDPNDARAKKPSPKQQNAIKAKLGADESKGTVVEKTSKFSLADGFSLDSSEGQRILKAKPRHIGEVQQAEMEREQAYFKTREKKEEMEAKMLTIKEIKVKAVQYLQCKYVAEKAGTICHEENHNLRTVHVLKKFFACRDCGERTVIYAQRYPAHACRKCGGKNYEKCAMWREKDGPKVGRETLLLRGPEYAKFLNSLETPKTNGILPKFL